MLKCPQCQEYSLSEISPDKYACDNFWCGYEWQERKQIPLYAPGFSNNQEYDLKTIYRNGGFRIFVSDKDIISDEKPHVHIKRKTGSRDHMKIWLENLEVEYNNGFDNSEEKQIKKIVQQNQDKFLQTWYDLRKGIN